MSDTKIAQYRKLTDDIRKLEGAIEQIKKSKSNLAKALLDENPNPTREEVRLAMQGVLCADVGYVKQIEAVEIAAEKMRGGE